MAVKKIMAVLGGAALVSLLAYARREPETVAVKPVQIPLRHLDPPFDGLRLVHISDLHAGPWMAGPRLEAMLDRVNAQAPDVIAITGDFVTNGEPYDPDALTAALKRLQPREVTVAVLGNHDHKHPYGIATLRRVLRDSGIIELNNRVHTLHREGACFHLAGVDDLLFQQARLDLVLAQLPATGAAVLLAHEPDFADVSAATGRFGLQLSGHSHGGQFILPFGKPLVLPRYAARYPVGGYWIDGMLQYTNRGLGTSEPRFRFNCRPEITVFTLRVGRHQPTGSQA